MAINVFTVSGNIGSDGLVLRYTPNGKAVGEMSIPCKQGYGEHEKTSWITCKMLGERAEKLSPYLHRGNAVTVTGEFVLEQWEKDGVKHSKPVIIINDIQLPPKHPEPTDRNEASQQAQNAAPTPPADGFDDDIPF